MKSNNRVLKVNLSDLSGREMSNREKMSLKGGDVVGPKCCTCGCCYEGQPGGATIQDNMEANFFGSMTTLCPEQSHNGCIVENEYGSGVSGDNCSGPA